jgi:hypothetical protein
VVKSLAFILGILILFPLIVLFGAAIMKALWYLCDMGVWAGLGHLPWGPAVFLALVLGGWRGQFVPSLLTNRGRCRIIGLSADPRCEPRSGRGRNAPGLS